MRRSSVSLCIGLFYLPLGPPPVCDRCVCTDIVTAKYVLCASFFCCQLDLVRIDCHYVRTLSKDYFGVECHNGRESGERTQRELLRGLSGWRKNHARNAAYADGGRPDSLCWSHG